MGSIQILIDDRLIEPVHFVNSSAISSAILAVECIREDNSFTVLGLLGNASANNIITFTIIYKLINRFIIEDRH